MTCHRSLRAGLGTLLVFALLLGTTALSANAQDDRPERTPPDPQTVADRAIERVEGLADRCDQRVNDLADKTVEKLPDLEPEKARLLVRHNKGAINRIAGRCVGAVRKTNRAAMVLLRHLDAPELAQAVHAASKDAIADIRASREAAIKKIDDALPPDDAPDTGPAS